MQPSSSNKLRTVLAYFSHSYRRTEKDINLFFWELLSRHNLYFTVDTKGNVNRPMDISYLEWMMQRSACFVAVIPRRDEPPYNCSRYQLFENSLAIRSRKPRLIFVEEGLDETIFGVQPGEVCSFRRRKEWLEEDKDKFIGYVERLAQQVHSSTPRDYSLRKPVALLVDTTQGSAYDNGKLKSIRRTVRQYGYSFRVVKPTDFEHDFLFLHEIERYSILISEIRPPYITPDILGLAHGRCIPTIRICHLQEHETAEIASAAMHLSHDEDKWTDQDHAGWPLIFSKYQTDNYMEPVIFWKQFEELTEKVSECLQRIAETRVDLLTEQEARDYFLSIGRLPGQVFISNPKAQNDFAYKLKRALYYKAIKWFHYKDKDAIEVGSSSWLSEIIEEIRDSNIFLALYDSNYKASKWCMSELREALDLFHQGKIHIHVCVLDPSTELPEELSAMQVDFIENLEGSKKIRLITERTVEFLDKGKRVNLRNTDRDKTIRILGKLPSFASLNECQMLFQDAGLPTQILEKAQDKTLTGISAAAEIVDDLAGWEEEVKPQMKALGLLLSHAMELVDSMEEQRSLAKLIWDYRLMPRFQIRSLSPLYELGLVYFHERKELGTFQAIHNGVLEETDLKSSELFTELFALSTKSSYEQDAWQEALQIVGSSLSKVLGSLAESYLKTPDHQRIHNEQIGFCFATDTPGLGIPFEWATLKDHSTPLCLNHPVRHFLVGPSETRPTLLTMYQREAAIPMGVLLVASNTTNDIEEVESEIEDIYSMFCELFKQAGWPESNICRLHSESATPSRIEAEIRSGQYQLLHFAGHSGYDGGKPVFPVYQDESMQQEACISATMLKNWIDDSDLRFVYMSSCRSAAPEVLEARIKIRHFENIGQAIIDAHVPEVIGFVWPIEDKQSRLLASRFYKEFLEGFNPSLALYRARKSFEEDERIWAAPILIQQSDTQ